MSETSTQFADKREGVDISRRDMLIFAVSFLVGLAIIIGVLWLVFSHGRSTFAAARPLVGAVPQRSELQQRDELAAYLQRENTELERLAWTDSSRKFAKVPIEDAMALLAAKGDKR